MRSDHVVLLVIAACYAVAVPLVRLWMRKDDDMDSIQAFVLWLVWPFAVVVVVGAFVAKGLPGLLFPVPQVRKVKQRLTGEVDE